MELILPVLFGQSRCVSSTELLSIDFFLIARLKPQWSMPPILAWSFLQSEEGFWPPSSSEICFKLLIVSCVYKAQVTFTLNVNFISNCISWNFNFFCYVFVSFVLFVKQYHQLSWCLSFSIFSSTDGSCETTMDVQTFALINYSGLEVE